MAKFNEDTRVKIPTILHLTRLGYKYLSLKGQKWDEETNIFTDIFLESIQKINPDLDSNDLKRIYDDVALTLDNEDLGKAFYEKLIQRSGTRLIDFENFDNNSFHVVTELTYKKDDNEFRPDIILLINGMPLVFIEVKKPNNRDGILAERERINTRFQNKSFRKFVNITQFMVFSNNMEYDDNSSEQIEGAFYASTSYHKPIFNYFREEEIFDLDKVLLPEDSAIENDVLKDTNYSSIKNSDEFKTNKNPDKPTNRICTSLFQKERLAFMLKYSLAYVKESLGLQKHIMRYPQLFATKAVETKLDNEVKQGIIWHTQGSGKTALAYYNVRYLTDYFHKNSKVPKFYFIVDRLDLLEQSKREFSSRGLVVNVINSRDEFVKDIKSNSAIQNQRGKLEITVVNIQKFKEDPNVVSNSDYNINIQRVYFLDEVHRSYNPNGSFLSNLRESDVNSIKIGLTGTPLLAQGKDYDSKKLFGDYIHKYYYNASIADGYTLRLIREEVETQYKLKLAETLEQIEILEGNIDKKAVYAHSKFVEPMLDYIVKDFEKSRYTMDDNSIGGMVVCHSSDQAKQMFEIFNQKYGEGNEYDNSLLMAAEPIASYNTKKKEEGKAKKAALILHDIGTKEERKQQVEDFKDGKIDFLFVYNMLLTGFDAPRLKKLYVGRVIKAHNLLQALTRVNRTYKDFKYGYVVDFADIKSEFDKTNKHYFDELQSELGDKIENYTNLFKSKEDIEKEILEIKDTLFEYDLENAEIFSDQISKIDDRKQMLAIVKVLENSKSLYNLIRLAGQYETLNKLDFHKLKVLSRDANNRLALINTKEKLENSVDTTSLLNEALEDVLFAFIKVSEKEMILAGNLKDALRKAREVLAGNFDPKDKEFISLKEELERLFRKNNLTEISQEEMTTNIKNLNNVYVQAKELERKNQLLRAKFENDEKYVRVYKRLRERGDLTDSQSQLLTALQSLKKVADEEIIQNANSLNNEAFITQKMIGFVLTKFKKENDISLNPEKAKFINTLVVNEYINEYKTAI